MEDFEKNDDIQKNVSEEIFSKAVRAGKRTYFFDVKATKRNDYYLTITESKKRFNQDGRHFFEKHKLFLYQEDFEKFIENLTESVNYIKENQPEIIESDYDRNEEDHDNKPSSESFSDISFDDLDKNK
jgi:hypothetical protein